MLTTYDVGVMLQFYVLKEVNLLFTVCLALKMFTFT
jgi:hypothetical protein